MRPQQFDSLALKVLKVIGQRAQLEPWVYAELQKSDAFHKLNPVISVDIDPAVAVGVPAVAGVPAAAGPLRICLHHTEPNMGTEHLPSPSTHYIAPPSLTRITKKYLTAPSSLPVSVVLS